MKIVILDGYTLNPGDLSWEPLKELGDEKDLEHHGNRPCDILQDTGGGARPEFLEETETESGQRSRYQG